jgi:hypothetical protein
MMKSNHTGQCGKVDPRFCHPKNRLREPGRVVERTYFALLKYKNGVFMSNQEDPMELPCSHTKAEITL